MFYLKLLLKLELLAIFLCFPNLSYHRMPVIDVSKMTSCVYRVGKSKQTANMAEFPDDSMKIVKILERRLFNKAVNRTVYFQSFQCRIMCTV